MILKPSISPVAAQRERDAAMRMALTLCAGRGAQMTAMRRAVLELLWQSVQPQGAYDLRSQLQAKLGHAVGPPTVYRALEFLVEQRLAARIESRNAYVPCAHPDRSHASVFFVCDQCRTAVEVENPELEALMDQDAQGIGFRVARRVVEMQGTCASCCSKAASTERPREEDN